MREETDAGEGTDGGVQSGVENGVENGVEDALDLRMGKDAKNDDSAFARTGMDATSMDATSIDATPIGAASIGATSIDAPPIDATSISAISIDATSIGVKANVKADVATNAVDHRVKSFPLLSSLIACSAADM